jgi:hypothetical protein
LRSLRDFAEQLAHGQQSLLLKPFGAAYQHRLPPHSGGNLGKHFAHRVRRHGAQDHRFIGNHGFKGLSDFYIRRQADAGQISEILPMLGQFAVARIAVAPEGDLGAFVGQQLSQRRAPAAGADDPMD